jgi:hypothetical protein
MRKLFKSNFTKFYSQRRFSQKFSFSITPEILDHISRDRNEIFESGLRKLKKEVLVIDNSEGSLLTPSKLKSSDILSLENIKLQQNEAFKSYCYSNLMKTIVNNSETISNYLNPEEMNYETFIHILQESGLKKEYVRENACNDTITQYTYEKMKILLKYLIILYDSFEESKTDPNLIEILYGVIKYTALEKFQNNFDYLEFIYLLTRIKDKIKVNENSCNLNKYLIYMKINREQELFKILNMILTTNDVRAKNELFFKLIYSLAKSPKSNKENSILRLQEPVKSMLLEYLDNLDLTTDKYFRNNEERCIIFYLCLKKLNLLKLNLVRNINFEYFSLGSLHIIYTLLLKEEIFQNKLNTNSIDKIFLNTRTKLQISEYLSFREVYLMRNTLYWYIDSTMKFINYHNYRGQIQFTYSKRVYELFNIIVTRSKFLINSNEIIYAAYFINKYLSDPEEELKNLAEENIDINNLSTDILAKFLDSVLLRFEYAIKYEHEVFILNKLKKSNYVTYYPKLDNIIMILTNQFLEKVKYNVTVNYELLSSGLKLLKIICKVDEMDTNYNISIEVISSMKNFMEKILKKGSDYISILEFEEIETIIYLFPYVEYHYNSIANLFHHFILYSIRKEYSISEKIRVVHSLLRYFILSPSTNENILNLRNEISSYLASQLSLLFNVQSNKLNTLPFDETMYSHLMPALILNLYIVFSSNRDRYAKHMALLENHIKSNKGLRGLQGYNLIYIKKDLLSEGTLMQILSNLQTLQPLKNKQNFVNSILTEQNIKKFLDIIIEALVSVINTNNSNSNSNSGTGFNFSSLSYLVSTIMEKFNDEEMIRIFKILGNSKIENYHPLFIRAILARYSDRDMLFGLLKKKEDDFFNLALNWPLFIRNEELLRAINYCHISKLLQFKRYEIISLITYNRIKYIKLLSFFGTAINKIKSPQLKKKVLTDYIKNCTYLGYQLTSIDYEEMLFLYSQLHKSIEFTTQELNDILVIGIISNLIENPNVISKESKDIYTSIINLVAKAHTLRCEVKTEDGKQVSFYPSIPSEERSFQKSIFTNITVDKTSLELDDTNEEIPTTEESPNYLKKSREGFMTVDVEYENFLNKKKELMYKHQAYLNDNFESIEIIKKWLVSKFFDFDLQDEHLENQLEQILNLNKSRLRGNPKYENFYLSLTSFCLQRSMVIEGDYKDRSTSMIVDYRVLSKGKTFYIIIVPEKFCSINNEDNSIYPDGTYLLVLECLKKNKDINIILLLESQLKESTEDEFIIALFK